MEFLLVYYALYIESRIDAIINKTFIFSNYNFLYNTSAEASSSTFWSNNSEIIIPEDTRTKLFK
jgi:hypothetical protein